MPQTSFAVMTTLGRAKEAAALANATTITVTQIAIGDGATVPSGGETALYNEVARKAITGHGTVVGAANVAYFDCYLAAGDGPYTIREAGLYDDQGDLIAIAHYDPPINKPVPASGQTVEGTVRLEVAFSDVANVTIVVDPSMQVALQRLTRLPWIPIISMSLSAPPALPAAGDTYVIAAAPTGAWAGQAGKIAEYTTAGWAILTPPDGHGVSLPDGRVFERIAGVYVEKLALDVQSGKWSYIVAGGTASALTATAAPAPLALVAGMSLRLMVATTSFGPATLNLNALGAKPIVNRDGTALSPGALVAGAIVDLTYDGTSWQKEANERSQSRTMRNMLINGDFSINQRGFVNGAVANGSYSVDRWKAVAAGTSLNIAANVATVTGSLRQVIEDPRIAGQVVTISCQSPTADLTVKIGDSGANTVTGTIAAGAGRRGVILTVPALVTGDVYLTITGTAAAFADLQCELGAGSAFDRRSPGDELSLCQRYFQTWQPGVVGARICTAVLTNAGDVMANLFLPVAMRVPAPTVTLADMKRTFSIDGDITGIGEVYLRNGNNLSVRFVSGTVTGGPYVCTVSSKTTAAYFTLDADY